MLTLGLLVPNTLLVVQFLLAVGLDPETAEADAEGLEHHASEKALAAFARFLAKDEAD